MQREDEAEVARDADERLYEPLQRCRIIDVGGAVQSYEAKPVFL